MTLQWKHHIERLYGSTKTSEGTPLLAKIFGSEETWDWQIVAGHGLVAIIVDSGTEPSQQAAKDAVETALTHIFSEDETDESD